MLADRRPRTRHLAEGNAELSDRLASTGEGWRRRAAGQRRRLRAGPSPEVIAPSRVAPCGADLANGLGRLLTVDAILDATEHLLTSSAADHVLEERLRRDDDLQRVGRRLLRVEASRNPDPAAMRLLGRIAHLQPIAVVATGPAGGVYAAWASQTLLLQRSTPTGAPLGGSQHKLPLGPGAYTTSPHQQLSAAGTAPYRTTSPPAYAPTTWPPP